MRPIRDKYKPITELGLGGVAIGNGFKVNDDITSYRTVEAAWEQGIRYFDTSPLYGLGISERRMGLFLAGKSRNEFTLSTKVGRILKPHENFDVGENIWKGNHNFSYTYDYTASGTRRSVEDSLQRLGLSSLDIVYIHDISPENVDMKEQWVDYFQIALKGAMPELIKMREEGIIKGWGLGVNKIEPIIKTIEQSDPDIFLSATQYSLIHHSQALNQLFPLCEERNISLVIGAPLNAGFLAGQQRYDYDENVFPHGAVSKLKKIREIASDHNVDVLSAALKFSAAPKVVCAVIPGASAPEQVLANNDAFFGPLIPSSFWTELKKEQLIDQQAPLPGW